MQDPQALAEKIIPITLSHIHREFPNYLPVYLETAGSFISPQTRHPAFYGSFDWHSSVHSHWQLLRAIRTFPTANFVAPARQALTISFETANLETEYAHFQRHPNFERPYGWAWYLQLCAEAQAYGFQSWIDALRPLEKFIVERFMAWLPKLSRPTRTGTHQQTAFALGLAYDYATATENNSFQQIIHSTAHRFYAQDKNAPIQYEPSGLDFLSPTLATADLMRRVMDTPTFSTWLTDFLPPNPELVEGLSPVTVTDPNDGQDAHFGGLNLSRAWMLQAIAAALPPDDPRSPTLTILAQSHKDAGIPYALRTEYMLSHWVPTFAIYLLTLKSS